MENERKRVFSRNKSKGIICPFNDFIEISTIKMILDSAIGKGCTHIEFTEVKKNVGKAFLLVVGNMEYKESKVMEREPRINS